MRREGRQYQGRFGLAQHTSWSSTTERGQSQDWQLIPPIGRYPKVARSYEDWPTFHDDLLDRFMRLGKPYITGSASDEAETWVVAQHHGLPTRLLDTATNPLKALYFHGDGKEAIEKGRPDTYES